MKRTPTGESLLSAGEELKKTTEPDRRARRDWATDLNYIAQSYLPLNKTSCLTGFGSSFSGSKKILQFNERSPGRNQKLTGPAIWTVLNRKSDASMNDKTLHRRFAGTACGIHEDWVQRRQSEQR
jgi:hypothetical protein